MLARDGKGAAVALRLSPIVERVADRIFEHPRLVGIYDALEPDRSDLDVYLGIAEDLGARRVLDVGCGTGTFALLLADRGVEVTAADPAGASLAVARTKPGAERVHWLHGDATVLPRTGSRKFPRWVPSRAG